MKKNISENAKKALTKVPKKKLLGIAAAAGAVSLLAAGTIATKIVKSRKAEEEEDLELEKILEQMEETPDDQPYEGPQVIIEAGIIDDLEENDEASGEKEETAETQEPDATAEEAAEESAEVAVEEPAEEPAGDADEEPAEEPAGDADEEPVEDAVG